MSDPSKELTLRVHDECNGSDVFGSDICTCKPYLIFAIEECIRCAQRGGVGIVVYFRKEGRALGEVTKYVSSFGRAELILINSQISCLQFTQAWRRQCR
jgi:GTP cyclohydrolase II